MQLFRSILSRRMLALILCAVLIYVNAFTSVKVFAKVCTNQPAFRCTANKQAEADQAHNNDLAITAKAAVLIDNASGRILYAKNKDKKLIPASITKIMTLLLIFESIEQGKCKLECLGSFFSQYSTNLVTHSTQRPLGSFPHANMQ